MTALKGVLKHAGKNVSVAVRSRIYSVLKDLIHHEDDQVRVYAESILGILTKVGLTLQLSNHVLTYSFFKIFFSTGLHY